MIYLNQITRHFRFNRKLMTIVSVAAVYMATAINDKNIFTEHIYLIYILLFWTISENLTTGKLYIVIFKYLYEMRFTLIFTAGSALANFVSSVQLYENYTKIRFNFKLYNWRNVHLGALHKQ